MCTNDTNVYAAKLCKGFLSRTFRVFQGGIATLISKGNHLSQAPYAHQRQRFCYDIFKDRNLAKEVRRRARLEEMKALMAPLDRFYAKSKSGEVMGREEMEEGKRMERLFRRWLRSLEDNAVADDEGRSLVVMFEKRPGWVEGG